uniref:Peptidase M12A domain-containing protein n=1 Tax=Romanomermis culicivorax TaxID=13658 RepID=A0A915HMP8_ROMCU
MIRIIIPYLNGSSGHATSYLANELQNGKWLNLQERPAWLSHLRGVIKSPKPVTSHPILSEYSLKTSGPDSGGSSYPFQPNFFYNQWRSHYLPNNPFRSGLYPQETSQEPSLEDYGASTPSFDESSTDMPMKTPDFDQQTTELSSTTTSSAASVSAASEDLESTSMPQSPESSTDMPTTALDYDQKTSEKSPTSTVNVDSVPATSEDWQSNSTPQSSESSTIFIPKKVGEIIYPIAWPNGVVPYYVDDQNMTWYEKLLLQRAIEGFHRYTCVRFMPAERQSRPIAIISNQLKDKFGQVSKNAIQ